MFHKDADKGPVKTTGITMIQAAYGHNEGVVNSRVVVDTYVAQMIDGKPVFYPVIRAKRERLVPSDNGLVMTKNGPRMMTAPALSSEALITLKLFANALETYYGYPMDVEFVVRDKTIWIVQARPITYKAELKDVTPGYLELEKIASEKVFKGRTIGAFGGAVVEVALNKNCIISDRIGTALDTYRTSKRDIIKCVFSGTDAPATSHEATTFRGEGKPVLYVSNIVEFRKVFTGGKKLLFSPQQHCVIVVDKAEQPEVIAGWCAYPLPQELSVRPILFVNKGEFVNPECKKENHLKISVLFKKLCGEDTANVVEAAQKLPNAIFNFLMRNAGKVIRDEDIDAQARRIFQAVQELCRRIVALCDNKRPLLERLLPINYLKALVYQQLFAEKALGYLSVATLTKTLNQENVDKASTQTFGSEELKPFHVQLKKVAASAFDDTTKNAWNNLINALAKNTDCKAIQTLGAVIKKLQEFDILPLWLHSTMIQAMEKLGKNAGPDGCTALVKEWALGFNEFAESFEIIKQLSERVAAFDIGRFADPKKFTDAWKEFEALLTLFMDVKLTNIITAVPTNTVANTSQQLAGAAACNVMSKFVELFDLSIKSMKGSNLWEKKAKPATFKMMLEKYYALLEGWIVLVPENAICAGMSKNDDFLKCIMDVLIKKKCTIVDLEATKGFNATAFVLGSGAYLKCDVTRPTSFEDAFMLIHQDLLVVLRVLINKCGAEKMQRSELLQSLETMVQKLSKKVSLIGVEISSSGIHMHYNYPLRWHSSQFFLGHNTINSKVYLTMQFYGHRPNRWKEIVMFAQFVEMIGLVVMQDNEFTASGCSCTFIVSNQLDVDALKELIEQAIHSTLDVPNAIYHPFAFGNYFSEKNIISSNVYKSIQEKCALNNFVFANKMLLYNFKALVKKSQGFTDAIDAAKKAVISNDRDMHQAGLELFTALVEKKQGFTDAIDIAKKAVISGYDNIRQAGLELFTALVEKVKGLPDAIDIAKEAVMSGYDNIRQAGYKLFNEEVEKDGKLVLAIEVIQKAVMSGYDNIRQAGFKLFTALVEKEGRLVLAIEVIQKAVRSDADNIRQAGFKLFTALVEKEKGLTEAINAAKEAMLVNSSSVLKDLVKLFTALVEKGKVPQEAIDAAKKAVISDDPETHSAGLELIMALIEKEQSLPEAIEWADKLFQSESLDARTNGFNLYMSLVKQGLELEKAIKAAEKALISFKDTTANVMVDEDVHDREMGLKLFQALVEQDMAYLEVKKAAQEAMSRDHNRFYEQGLILFQALIQKDKMFPEAIKAAEKAIGYIKIVESKDDDDDDDKYNCDQISFRALSLLKSLVEKEQGKAVYTAIKTLSKDVVKKVSGLKELFEELEKKWKTS